ncbi:MAG TPA: transcription-repair coupling factor [Thermoanaerobaculia bacterium]|jgi:transcription-repair coupling factor (superfamily II helicase)|nr:transcription-repair coupling factor [Thermoanaerobaculia bacterium]
MPEPSPTLTARIRGELARTKAFKAIGKRIEEERLDVTGAAVEARALILATLQETTNRRIAIVVPGDAAIDDFEASLRLFHWEARGVSAYPSPSLSPYQDLSPSLGVVRNEIRALGMLIDKAIDVLLIPARALFSRLPRPEEFAGRIVRLSEGAELDMRLLLERLVENGFVRTDLVGEAGEFAFRGGILDLFPPNTARPVRVELFGDTIDSLRWFEVETQRSEDESGPVSILPMTHFAVTKPMRTALARRLSLDFMDPLFKRDVADKIDRLNENGTFPGIEHYVPVAAETVSFLEYLDPGEWMFALIEPDQITTSVAKFESLLRNEYDAAAEKGRAVYPPEKLTTAGSDVLGFLDAARLAFGEVHVGAPARRRDAAESAGGTPALRSEFEELRLRAPQVDRYTNRLPEFTNDVKRGHGDGRRQVFFAATKGGREKVERLLKEFDVPFVAESDELQAEIVIASGALPRGFDFEELNLTVYSEWDLFEPPTSTRVGGKKRASEAFVTDLRDLKVGDYIVHVDHGVGRFQGLQRIPFGPNEREVMEIEYSGGGKLLMPMENLNLIQKFSGGADTQPKLDRLGGTAWARTKASVKKAMRDMADELLKLYATRQMVQGHAFSKDSPWQFEFEDAFEFDETEDQESAINDVKSDMESRKPMDRLLCGDVGYGKTEVAMRAAFKSVMDGKQVVVLAPTTVLAYQHYRTFMRRFASFPVTIELLTRYYSAKEQKAILAKLETGEIDVIIGTHRVLSKDIKLKDVGLLVIDEEQRFGVGQKEKLKQLKKAIDVLSMSATPIPRTLHMSLVGIRDISVIETPPKDRLAIQTAVVPFTDDFIREAIEFETGRGGQTFFVHNRVESIYAMKEYLEKLVPGLKVIVGHGQMEERELERAMLAFIQREYDLLLATTIIENGIDIPACNTILINHAERFGLSQLYQLRGRVGRSDRLAFCYLLVPSDKVLASDARKRLAAIQEFSDLGAGFRIAAKDLEIRGAGNILGGEQSGQIAAVGFEMYTRLLEETIREMKGERIEEEVETSMNLGVDIYIPKDYISDENLRMTFYKKVASASTDDRLDEIRNELRDRFGALPANVENLLRFVQVKRFAQQMGVISIVREGARAVVKLTAQAKVDPNKLLVLIQQDPQMKFSPNGVLTFPLKVQGPEVIDAIEATLRLIAA